MKNETRKLRESTHNFKQMKINDRSKEQVGQLIVRGQENIYSSTLAIWRIKIEKILNMPRQWLGDHDFSIRLCRIFDVIGASIGIILFSIPMILIAEITKISSPGPIIFVAKRIGLNGKLFNFYKFRSMTGDAPQKTKVDQEEIERITPFGHFLRKTNLDELPQLFNVLKGNLSLVGWRPHFPDQEKSISDEMGEEKYAQLLSYKPGITMESNLRPFYSSKQKDRNREMAFRHFEDLHYLKSKNPWNDLLTIYKTAVHVIYKLITPPLRRELHRSFYYPFEFDINHLDFALKLFKTKNPVEDLKALHKIKGIESVKWENDLLTLYTTTEVIKIHDETKIINERLGLKDRIYITFHQRKLIIKIYAKDLRDRRPIPHPNFVIGVTRTKSHDSAAVLVKDGEIIGAIEEERLNRDPHTAVFFPERSIRYLLSAHSICWEDVSHMTVGWDFNWYVDTPHSTSLLDSYIGKAFHPSQRMLEKTRNNPACFETKLKILGESFGSCYSPPVTFVNHHKAHAISAYYTCPFKDEPSLIVVLDGRGEIDSGSIWLGQNGKVEKLSESKAPHSLGFLYYVGSKYIGYDHFGEGKVMGLAPFGRAKNTEENERIENLKQLFDELLWFDRKSRSIQFNDEYLHFVTITNRNLDFSKRFHQRLESLVPSLPSGLGGSKVNPYLEKYRPYVNFAYSLQDKVEQIALEMIKFYLNENPETSHIQNLVLAGGIALNISLNGRLISEDVVEPSRFYVPPFPADDGTAIGAALSVQQEEYALGTFRPLSKVSLGRPYSDDEIKQTLERFGLEKGRDFKLAKDSIDLFSNVTTLLNAGKTIAWFQGGSEFGPRALGYRSILHSVCDTDGNKKMNLAKGREFWRPSAFSITEEAASVYLENIKKSPYMTVGSRIIHQSVEKGRRNIESGIHPINETTRPQTVSKSENPLYWGLLNEMGKKTGIPGVINSSFNRNEPIVETPEEALNTFFYSIRIDSLAIGNFIVSRSAILRPSIISAYDEETLKGPFKKAMSPHATDKDWQSFWDALQKLTPSKDQSSRHFICLEKIASNQEKASLKIPLFKEIFHAKSRIGIIHNLFRQVLESASPAEKITLEVVYYKRALLFHLG